MSLTELANRAARRIHAAEILTDERRRRTELPLHHTHLPQLESASVVVYDRDRRQVADAAGTLPRKLLRAAR